MAPMLVQLLSICVVILLSINVGVVTSDPAKDREDCAQQLVGLATCLPYVGGRAKAPTPDCCKGLKQVLKDNKKCLCVIIRDRDDPDLDLHINVTLALSLPTVCDAPANVSKCPELLNMDPKSSEAQVFYQLERNSTQNETGPSPSPAVAGGPTSANTEVNSNTASAKNTSGFNFKVKIIIVTILFYLLGSK